MLRQIEYIFTDEDLHDAFADVINRVARELTTEAAAALDRAVMLTIEGDESVILEKTEGHDDAVFVSDAETAVEQLEAILEAFSKDHQVPRDVVLEAFVESRIPLLFLETEFEVSEGEIDHRDLFRVTVENNAGTGSNLRAVMRAGPATNSDFWNLVLDPLGITDRIQEVLEAAGVDPAGYDHDGGDTVDGRDLTDFYYKMPGAPR